jgi:hypothetical protein
MITIEMHISKSIYQRKSMIYFDERDSRNMG